ncbi:MAG: addiction module protein [Brachymonas sp.]|nr:addiction module protein [Brachymonas sp.]
MQTDVLEHHILDRPPQDRARILEKLIASLDEDEQLAAAWANEAMRRDEAADRDPSLLIPAEEVFARARALLS